MTTPQLSDTLDALRAQRDAAEERVANAHRELAEAQVILSRLVGAIASLELLLSPTHDVDIPVDMADAGDAPTVSADTPIPEPPQEVVDTPRTHELKEFAAPQSPPPAIAPYASQSGGKRLKSKLMVADLLRRIGEPVSRANLISAFFDYYGREELREYWARPENALNTAIDRSREEGLIRAFKDPVGGHAVFVAANAASGPSHAVQPAMYGEDD